VSDASRRAEEQDDTSYRLARTLHFGTLPVLKKGVRTPSLSAPGGGDDVAHKAARAFDLKLVTLIFFWYVGNYYHNIANKIALKAGGGVAGYPLTISTCYLGVGVLYALFLWAAPDARPLPKITWSDYVKTLPVSFMFAGAHLGSCFALSAGSLSFIQIIKALEPGFAAVVCVLFYRTRVSSAKRRCLLLVIGGVVLASLGELDFAWVALFVGCLANAFAAFKANENKKLMQTDGFKERMGSVGNLFAVSTINAFLFCVVFALIFEGHKLGSFVELVSSPGKGKDLLNNMIASGLWFYLYNELATITIQKTNGLTQSVLNTAKRAFIILGAAIVLNEGLSTTKLLGSVVAIAGVFLYSTIDTWVKK